MDKLSARVIEMTKFLVVDRLSAYNAIITKPAIHKFKVVSFSYHTIIKFPTKYGASIIKGNQAEF